MRFIWVTPYYAQEKKVSLNVDRILGFWPDERGTEIRWSWDDDDSMIVSENFMDIHAMLAGVGVPVHTGQ